jgi:hypothetical protein
MNAIEAQRREGAMITQGREGIFRTAAKPGIDQGFDICFADFTPWRLFG